MLTARTTGLLGSAQQFGEAGVERRHTLTAINKKDAQIGVLHGAFGLGAHAHLDAGGRVLIPGRVDQAQIQIAQTATRLAPVAGNARTVINNGQRLAGKPVEQGGLAHIGAADNGQGGQAFHRMLRSPLGPPRT